MIAAAVCNNGQKNWEITTSSFSMIIECWICFMKYRLGVALSQWEMKVYKDGLVVTAGRGHTLRFAREGV